MTDEIYYLGPAPAMESCAQVGDPDYARDAKIECKAYIEAIRKTCGREPEGARLGVKSEQHDFGTYFETVVRFDGNNRVASEYAAKVDEHAPATWAEAGMEAPGVGRSR